MLDKIKEILSTIVDIVKDFRKDKESNHVH